MTVREIGDSIVRTHDGQMWFNMGEAATIVKRRRESLPGDLHEAGISVYYDGKQKLVDAYSLAEFRLKKLQSPIDNIKRYS